MESSDRGAGEGAQAASVAVLEGVIARLQAELRDTAELLTSSQRASEIGSYRLDVVSGTWTSSPMLDAIFAIDADYVRDVDGWAALIHPDHRADMVRYFAEEVLGRRAAFDREYPIVRHRDGAPRWVLGRGELTLGPDGAPVWMIGTIQDITARKLAEEELRESEGRYRRLAENARDLVWRTDAFGKVLYVNGAVERLLGISIAQALALGIEGYLVPESAAAVRAIVRTALGQQPPVLHFTHEVEYRRGDGVPVVAEIQANLVLDAEGRLAFVEGITRDLTARRRAEEERTRLRSDLVRAQKLESIGTLAGGIAHDFNNLLGGILASIAVLEVDAEERGESAEAIRDAKALVHRGADLTKQLLAFARLGKVDPKVIDLCDQVRQTAAMFARTRKDVRIDLDRAPVRCAVLADASQIEQATLNLLINAGQAMPRGGNLRLRCAIVAVDDAEAGRQGVSAGRYVQLSVSDDGVGMDGATRARIFEPFFTTKGPGEGSGLGLASVYGIVHNHGGFLTVDSAPGAGSTFCVHLPATDLPVPEQGPRGLGPRRGTETILVVDDEDAVARAARRLLERVGYAVFTAGGGADAIEIVRSNAGKIDLVILDMIMPGLDGTRTFDALRALAPDLKILLASGYSVDGAAAELLARGNVGFIGKPYDLHGLSAKLREML